MDIQAIRENPPENRAPQKSEIQPSDIATHVLNMLSIYEKAGIASRDRLNDAPGPYHPRNIMPDFQSIIVLAREPKEVPKENEPGKYHGIIGQIAGQDSVIRYLKDLGFKYKLIGSRATQVSLPKLGERSGVGQISPFSTLAVKGHGLRTVLSAIITDAPLRPSPLVTDACAQPEKCLKKCPALAEDGTFDRGKCKSCGACVKTCPN